MKKLLMTSTIAVTLAVFQGNSDAKTLAEMKEALLNFVRGTRPSAPITKQEEMPILPSSSLRASINPFGCFADTISPRNRWEGLEQDAQELNTIGLASGAMILKGQSPVSMPQQGSGSIFRQLTDELEEIGPSGPSSPDSSVRANYNKGLTSEALQAALQKRYAKELHEIPRTISLQRLSQAFSPAETSRDIEEEGSLSSTHSSSLSLTSSGSGGSFVEFEDHDNAHVHANVYNTLGNGFRDTFFLSSGMDEKTKEAVWMVKLRQREAQYLRAKYPYPGFINVKDKDGKRVSNVEAGYKALFRLENN